MIKIIQQVVKVDNKLIYKPLLQQVVRWLVILICLCGAQISDASNLNSGVTPENLAVIINTNDPKSVEVGEYYMAARHIPQDNLIKVALPLNTPNLSLEQLQVLRIRIYHKLTPNIQAMLLVWTTPFAVGCNSITSALTLGYDAKQCDNGCSLGKESDYFDAKSRQPFTHYGLRLSMLLPIESVEKAKALIDRGVLSAFKTNEASAYFLKTSDTARSSRALFFPKSARIDAKKLELKTLDADFIKDKHDVMFYFTGQSQVEGLDTLTFMPGAIADHLTSFGGDLLGTGQMSSMKWLDAGATGSYGTVSEPCNYWQKFPNPRVVLQHYLAGETLIEAYWKSVKWPAQGVFIGEPLAAPYQMPSF